MVKDGKRAVFQFVSTLLVAVPIAVVFPLQVVWKRRGQLGWSWIWVFWPWVYLSVLCAVVVLVSLVYSLCGVNAGQRLLAAKLRTCDLCHLFTEPLSLLSWPRWQV